MTGGIDEMDILVEVKAWCPGAVAPVDGFRFEGVLWKTHSNPVSELVRFAEMP